MKRLSLLVLLSLTLVAQPAYGGVFDIFGFGSRNIAMGNAATASADDHTAVFYNPGSLTRRKVIQLGATFVTMLNGLDIKESVPPADANLEAVQAQTQMGLSLGVLFPLGGRIDNRVAFGLGVYVPLGGIIRIQSLDPSTPRWFLYNSLPDKLQIVLGAAFELTDWVSLGFGIQSLAELDGDVDLEIDLGNGRLSRRDVVVQLINTAAPIVGLDFRPAKGLTLGVTYRAALELLYTLPLFFDLGDGLNIDVAIRGVDLYTPHQLSVGGAYTLEAPMPLTLSLDATLSLWSLAPDPSLEVAVTIGGDLPEGLGLEDVLTLEPGPTPAPGFNNSLTVRVGAEIQPTDWLFVRTGYFWRQSALDRQDNVTSFLDSDAHVASLGAAFTFPDPLEINDRPVIFDLVAQFVIHPEDTAQKQPGNPVGPVTYGGVFYTLGATIRHDF